MMAFRLGNVLILYELFFWARGSPCFKRSSAEFSTEFYELEIIFQIYRTSQKWIVNHFLNGLGYQMPCGLLFGFQETETYSRARDGCHVSTFLGQGVTTRVRTL